MVLVYIFEYNKRQTWGNRIRTGLVNPLLLADTCTAYRRGADHKTHFSNTRTGT